MLVNITQESRQWISEFNQKFANFCRNAPILLSFDTSDSRHIVVQEWEPISRSETWTIDLSIKPTDMIARIKEFLHANWYPVVKYVFRQERDLTSEEISNLVINYNYSFEEAVEQKKSTETKTLYRIEKIYNDQNSLMLRNLETDDLQKYHAAAPIALILQKINKDDPDASEFTFGSLERIDIKNKESY